MKAIFSGPDMAVVMSSLDIMWKGMLGIFVVMILLLISVKLLGLIKDKKQ